jgi:hypothetical protein
MVDARLGLGARAAELCTVAVNLYRQLTDEGSRTRFDRDVLAHIFEAESLLEGEYETARVDAASMNLSIASGELSEWQQRCAHFGYGVTFQG